MASILIIATLDTKGREVAFLRDQIESRGHSAVILDAGVLGAPAIPASVSREEVARAAGVELADLAAEADRGKAVAAMARGAEVLARRLFDEGRIAGVLGLGGGSGTAIATAAMRALPLGVPKLMVSTVASGDVRGFVGVKDIVMMPAIVDVSGVNRISRRVFAQAAGAVCGMVETRVPPAEDRPLICASMFGNTTPCVERARAILEAAGYEVLVFHATGAGGQAMESLIEAGYAAGVLDVTTTEWADQLVGGVMAAGPARLEAAARGGFPALIAPGCLDMVNFWAPETVPARFSGRLFYRHNPNVTLMRTTPAECAELGRILAEKVNLSTGPAAVYLPLRGISVVAAEGGPFHWPEADAALFDAIRRGLRQDIELHEIDANINDAAFAEAVANGLLRLVRQTVNAT
ncbi:MAG: Tm-1-like ATP-binding domain-containing protein [Bryobacteraceae bacterium]|nr:Tm-1-like ATP-binding domain-containing protein [Bryobacteraceae bacterium]